MECESNSFAGFRHFRQKGMVAHSSNLARRLLAAKTKVRGELREKCQILRGSFSQTPATCEDSLSCSQQLLQLFRQILQEIC